jgi:hypothetical protein
MILVSIEKQKEGNFLVNRWKKEKNSAQGRLVKTHEAVVREVPSAAQIGQFYGAPPDILRVK